MATVLDVGGYVYRRLGWIDAWKLEKLTYLAQAWHLAWDGRPLFADTFQAWPDGPVSPRLYQANKYRRDDWHSTELPDAHPDALDAQQKAVVDAVLDYYGSFTGEELVELTHQDSPWQEARVGLNDHAKSDVRLSPAEIRRCYTKRAERDPISTPAAPAATVRSIMDNDRYDAAIDRQLDRWAESLALLAER